MIAMPAELIVHPEFGRALAAGDWATALRLVVTETGVSGAAIAAATGMSQPHISRLLNGQVVEPGIRTVRMLCDGLGIPRSLAGLLDRDQEEDVTDRRQVLGGVLGLSGVSLVGTAPGGTPLGHTDDEQVLTVLSAAYRRLEHRLPSRLLLAPAAAHLSLVRQLRARAGVGRSGRRLASLTAESAGLVAWLYVDLDDGANARRHYRLAVKESVATGHPLLPAYMQASFGHFAVISGDVVQGLRLVSTARRTLPRSAPQIAHAWLDAIEAVAFAHHRDSRALALLDQAERRLGTTSGDWPAWPWLFRFDLAKLAAYRATAEAQLGRWGEADAAFSLAAPGRRAPKQAAVGLVEHARTLAARGEADRACTTAVSALDIGIRYGSERVVRGVADFRSGLGRAVTVAAELDEKLHRVYQDEP